MKLYRGKRTKHATTVMVEEESGQSRTLDPRHDLRNHSPTGFEWGYGGSGPAQLALALAADVLGDDEKAQDVYERLKFKLIGGLPDAGWVLTEDRVRTVIGTILEERQRSR